MAPEVFGDAVHDDVRSFRERVLQGRGGKGVVHGEAGRMALEQRSHRGNVRDPQEGVGRGLQPDESGLVVEDGGHIRGVLRVHEMKVDAEGCVMRGEEPARAAVEVVSGDDFIPGLQGHEDGVHRS